MIEHTLDSGPMAITYVAEGRGTLGRGAGGQAGQAHRRDAGGLYHWSGDGGEGEMPGALSVLKWYDLPDGTRVIACEACAGPDGDAPTGGYVLYDQSEWEAATTAGYEAQPDGRITLWGDDTGWTTDDLTGPTPAPR